MKTLIVFVFAAMFFISSIHYGATAATTPSTGLFFFPPFIIVDIIFSYFNEHIYIESDLMSFII